MQRLFQYTVHVICMIREMGVALNQAFIHCKQSSIVKRDAIYIVLCRKWLALRLFSITVLILIPGRIPLIVSMEARHCKLGVLLDLY
jgi:hypothetical protein